MDVDTNIENYMVTDLFDLLNLESETATVNQVVDSVNDYINEFENNENIVESKKEDMIDFFDNIRDALTHFIENERDEMEEDDNDLLGKNETEKNVVTTTGETRMWETVGDDIIINKTGDHNAMKDMNIDVPSIRTENIFKGILNPHMKNIVTRIVNIDSQFRQFVVENEYKNSGNFTIDLSEPLSNVLSIRCYSAQIPFSWYVFDSEMNTNYFFINDTKISIESGNYTLEELETEINSKILESNITDVSCKALKQSGKLEFNIDNVSTTKIIFYNTSFSTDLKRNHTFGWIIGFRKDEYSGQSKIKGEAVVDLYGTRYVYIYLDEFSSNRVNNSLVNLSDSPLDIKKQLTTIPTDLDVVPNENGVPMLIPEDPRKTTISKRYVINRIFENRSNNAAYPYLNAPTTTNIFTMIPIKKNGFPIGEPIIEFGGSLQSGERVYFGPVNITKFQVKLLDDKGRIMNLNGNDWSFSFLCETLYHRGKTTEDD